MAENEGLSNNNNNTAIRGSSTAIPLLPVDSLGRTESDATHIRLRTDLHPTESITCLSCGQTFESTSLLQIYEHYGECVHPRYFSNCLYCQGKVHQYCHVSSQQVLIYHNCLRWKRGEDK